MHPENQVPIVEIAGMHLKWFACEKCSIRYKNT